MTNDILMCQTVKGVNSHGKLCQGIGLIMMSFPYENRKEGVNKGSIIESIIIYNL